MPAIPRIPTAQLLLPKAKSRVFAGLDRPRDYGRSSCSPAVQAQIVFTWLISLQEQYFKFSKFVGRLS